MSVWQHYRVKVSMEEIHHHHVYSIHTRATHHTLDTGWIPVNHVIQGTHKVPVNRVDTITNSNHMEDMRSIRFLPHDTCHANSRILIRLEKFVLKEKFTFISQRARVGVLHAAHSSAK